MSKSRTEGKTQLNLMWRIIQWLVSSLRKLGIKLMPIRNFIIEKWNNREVMPADWSVNIIWFLGWVLYVFMTCWVFWWLSYVTVDSAKWALSAQVQATAAIFGLLIATIALRWRRITDQEQQLRNETYKYLQEYKYISTEPVFNTEYEKNLNLINAARARKERPGKQALIDLGRLFVIKILSDQYRLCLVLGRHLTWGQIKELSKISKLSEKSAINMYEDYHRRPEDFLLSVYKTFMSSQNAELRDIALSIISSNSKVIAEEVKRTRVTLRPFFYFTSLILAFAIVLGLCILTGIEGTLLPPIFSNPNNLMWVVGIPIGLSIFGVALCLDIIRRII